MLIYGFWQIGRANAPGHRSRDSTHFKRNTIIARLQWETARHISLALLATAIADNNYRIDPSRVDVSGFSGGGRTASAVAPEYAQLFTGAIYIGRVNFWEGQKPERMDRVRGNRYVFLTGSKDFNRSETRRVHRAYRRANVENVMLLEVPGMDHRMPPPEDLAQAIAFLDK